MSAGATLTMTLTLLGCAVSAAGALEQSTAPSYYRDIEPLVVEHCSACHRAEGAAPFALSSYADVKRRARQIVEVTRSGYMPPWLPEPGHGDFIGERRLTQQEIDRLGDWVDAGAPAGDPLPRRPRAVPRRRAPDLVVRMEREYTLDPEGRDVYRNFVVPVPLDRARWVETVELRPGNPKVVHHARILVDDTGRARELETKDEAPGYDGMLADAAVFPEGRFLGWSPGKTPPPEDEALSWPLPPGTDLVLQLHMLPTGKPETLRAEVALYFTDEPPARRSAILPLGSRTIDLPPGDASVVVEDRYVLPAPVDVIGIYPHAHHLCREMDVQATLPDGARFPLLRIASWDFFWQDEYRYREPVALPEGTTVTMRYVYDNSDSNPRNPFTPPRRVRWGPRSTDEMADVLLMVVPHDTRALEALSDDFRRHGLRQEVEGYRVMLRDHPSDPALHHELAFAYLELGRTEDAVVAWRKAIELRPDFAEAHYNLGGALARLGRADEAVAAYRRAVAVRPDYAEAHNNLGVILQAEGRAAEAASAYRSAIDRKPRYAFAHHNLGSLLLALGDVDAAVAELSEAVAIDPAYPEAHYTLGGALGRKGLLGEEVAHYRKALESRPDYVEALNNLGGVLVTLGEAGEAESLLRRALALRADYSLARLNLAKALVALEQLDAAEAEYRRVLAAEPENAVALSGLEWVLGVLREPKRENGSRPDS